MAERPVKFYKDLFERHNLKVVYEQHYKAYDIGDDEELRAEAVFILKY